MNKTIIKKYIFSFMLLLIIILFFMWGAFWLIVRDYSIEGKTASYIRRNGAMRITGVLGLLLSLPWILAIVKNIVLLFCDLVSDETINLNIKICSDLEFHLPHHSFYVIDSFNIKSKIIIILFLFWHYVFLRSYYFLNMDMANINDLQSRKKVNIIATKYSHIILSIQK